MKNKPIGVFDSGVGGLTAVKEIRKNMPGENIIYFGDTGRVPYGNRSQETIKKYASQIIRFLSSFDVKGIIAACGTVSTNFSRLDYNNLNISAPYFTVVEPSVMKAVQLTRNNKIGIMATTASIKSGKFQREIKKSDPTAEIVSQGCPLLVNLVEAGFTDENHPVMKAVLEMYLEPMIKNDVDTIILGCTHFPIIKKAISSFLKDGIQLVDAGAQGAIALERKLEKEGILTDRKKGSLKCYVTDTVGSFASVAKNFLDEDILTDIEKVEIELIDR